MDDEEDEDEVRTDTQPLLPGPPAGPVGAPLSSASQSGGGPSGGAAQHPESSIISFEDAPSRS